MIDCWRFRFLAGSNRALYANRHIRGLRAQSKLFAGTWIVLPAASAPHNAANAAATSSPASLTSTCRKTPAEPLTTQVILDSAVIETPLPKKLRTHGARFQDPSRDEAVRQRCPSEDHGREHARAVLKDMALSSIVQSDANVYFAARSPLHLTDELTALALATGNPLLVARD